MKLTPGTVSRESARQPCGQIVRGSLLGERCGEVVSHLCDSCGALICWLHTHTLERLDYCPACAEHRRAHALDALRDAVIGGQKLTDSGRLRALRAALARLAARQPRQARGLHRFVALLRHAWWRLWGG